MTQILKNKGDFPVRKSSSKLFAKLVSRQTNLLAIRATRLSSHYWGCGRTGEVATEVAICERHSVWCHTLCSKRGKHGSRSDREHRKLLRRQSIAMPQVVCTCKSFQCGMMSITNRHGVVQPGREISNAARTVHRQALNMGRSICPKHVHPSVPIVAHMQRTL